MRVPAKVVRQAGSAYLLALLALAVLAGLGIVLSRVAQVERQLGSAYLSRAQAMSAAESGLNVAVTRLVEADLSEPFELVFGEESSGLLVRGNLAVVESVVPVMAVPCDLCEMGSDSRWFRVDYGLVAGGERRVWRIPGSSQTGELRAAVSVEETLTLQPWPLGDQLFARLQDEEGSP